MRMMLRSLCLTAALCFAPFVSAATPAPDFSLAGDNKTIALTDLKGQVVYLDFWASWCTPCRKSFPWMNQIQERYGDKGLRIIAVNLDKDRALAAKFLNELPPKFAVLYDDGRVAERYGVQAMPSSYLIDREGRIVVKHLGFRSEDAFALEKSIADLVGLSKD